MFKTSAIFRMLSAFRLRIWPVAPALAPASAANDNQTAARPQGGRSASMRGQLICRWSAVDGGKRLACRWEKEADTPGPKPARSASSSLACPFHTDVVDLSYSKSGTLALARGLAAGAGANKNLRDSIVLPARHAAVPSRDSHSAPPSNCAGLSITLGTNPGDAADRARMC